MLINKLFASFCTYTINKQKIQLLDANSMNSNEKKKLLICIPLVFISRFISHIMRVVVKKNALKIGCLNFEQNIEQSF